MIDYLWSTFQQNPVILWGERAQNPLKMGHFMAAVLPRNHWNIYNLGTTNAIKIKLTANIYLYETFHLL